MKLVIGIIVAAALVAGAVTAGILGASDTGATREKRAASVGFDPAAPWDDYPGSTPEKTVLSYWRLIQVGAYPAAAQGYDQSVVRAVGPGVFLNALTLQRPGVAALKPRIVGVNTIGDGRVVAVDARNNRGNGGAFSFSLKRDGNQWVLAYDSLLGDGMEASLASSLQRRGGGGAERKKAATRDAAEYVDAYRRAGLEALVGNRKDAAIKSIDAAPAGNVASTAPG